MTLDVLIIGGGPAGATTAILLAKAGWSVGLIEKKEFPRKKVCGEFISATSLPLLQILGLEKFYFENGGPEVTRVGLYAGDVILTANMPHMNSSANPYGRALGREYLDTALINEAKLNGVTIWQPCEAIHLQNKNGLFFCTIKKEAKISETVCSLRVVMAYGSWGKKIDSSDAKIHKDCDLLAFKAHFKNCSLSKNMMPLLAFPGGYGGLVHSSPQQVALSCCIRRDTLKNLRLKSPDLPAGEAVFKYIKEHCRGVREVFELAHIDDKWLAAGPIQPGIRTCYKNGIFFVGNIAGEAHPVVAEGISMAMQSAWLLSQSLIQFNMKQNNNLNDAGKYYTQQWRKYFAHRIYASIFLAHLAMLKPWGRALLLPIIQQFPALLSLGAKFSGKTQQIVPGDDRNI
ncbi:NAD(P)/FAD-dependent oxidoreductase [Legionella longbeachae]|uniref:Protein CbrA n=1 Tax=Legionella longbeachae serogroup 1 (strain NSW150) TaxID=661367 RepID=D3HSU2_LEGLN|nr:FAD-dependent oxidoreductase [Legionella longbeachae]VEE02473.1 FAD dependent oxidoreductase [Legionella oakridgensis]HBD7399446.1 FAD-dependent monooxygenase [Legionella pneumophila]ARB91253.1 FAD-dependent oxidoreductase [Legionella longbeachae]EEZ94881.1 FAD dependent oxidoreductase domain protein [Legionella longbeachae D-4968]QEY51584.1 FAD-dependent oxidoreductase [Legionella longbeachae]